MRKKLITRIMATALVALLLLNNVTMIDAVTDDEYFAGTRLKQLDILKGYPDGGLHLEDPIKRSEVATIMVRIRGYEGQSVDGEGKVFTDLSDSHWAYDYIQNAYKLTIIQGYPDSSFKPENNISYAEVVAIMVNSLGYKDSLEGSWPDNYLNKGKELGVIPADSEVEATKIISRGEMALIVWDTLLVKLEDTSILQ